MSRYICTPTFAVLIDEITSIVLLGNGEIKVTLKSGPPLFHQAEEGQAGDDFAVMIEALRSACGAVQ